MTQAGPGCDGHQPECKDPPTCTMYGVPPNGDQARGACTVTVTFKSGGAPFQTSTNFAGENGSSCGTVANPDQAFVP